MSDGSQDERVDNVDTAGRKPSDSDLERASILGPVPSIYLGPVSHVREDFTLSLPLWRTSLHQNVTKQ